MSSSSCATRRRCCSPPPTPTIRHHLIRLSIRPNAGLTLHLLAKQPGAAEVTREILVSVDFSQALGSMQEAYEHVLASAVEGDPRHFASEYTLEQAWRIVGPLLGRSDTPVPYSPAAGDPSKPTGLRPAGVGIPSV